MSIQADLGTYDPYSNPLVTPWSKLAYDSLINVTPKGKFVSGLAKTWKSDLTSATFVLGDGITCSDGTALTASQVAADLTYVANPKNGSALYGSGVPTIPFVATGDDKSGTVSIKLKSPFAFLLNMLAEMPIVCKEGLKDPKSLAAASDGTGPFVLTKVVAGQSYTFTVRKGYTWGPDGASTSAAGTPKTVVLRVVDNETTATNMLLSGELNAAQIDGSDRKRASARGFETAKMPEPAVWLWPNQRAGRPTADLAVRSALVESLDLNELVAVSTSGQGRAATGLAIGTPMTCPAVNDVQNLLPSYDMKAAKAALDKAGWTLGSDGKRSKNGKQLQLTVRYAPEASAGAKPAAELIAQAWTRLGVGVTLKSDTFATLSQVMFKTGDYDVYVAPMSWSMPTQVYKYVTGAAAPAGLNFAAVDNADYNALAEKALDAESSQACGLWSKAEAALYRDVNVVPVAEQSDTYFFSGATAEVMTREIPVPTSIRVYK
ncbi:ABC transporter substrate-binding protein [Streptomyces fuscichromogenes]|uniref:Peptide ABC transporter substrate-binding protein n=1 Tax=Streptomyces fuscichromogenes TaxID=1324013 RepID=A0A918CTQ5_9ACTN|nr:ABC transporter substrate-binding protein [Streptomyces fuscichromogenes]GGN22729.1 peptide ABC transporter substrate-binding protein [Streptomyces fuscichromogenes]